MNKVIHDQLKETYYEETLENGLKVVIFHKPEFVTTSAIFATPYGALDFKQIAKDQSVKEMPSGIAHFLEHKLFESEEEDVMESFSKMGANVNAFTSYNETMYYFTTSFDEIEAPLNLLLDFVQDLSISYESVEKEKGIIVQELKMYMQMPESKLLLETFKSLFHQHPLNQDIGGSEESVLSTTKEQLEETHRLNYHPANMILVIMTPNNVDEMIRVIQENQNKKQFDTFKPLIRFPYDEPYEVLEKEKAIRMGIGQPKVCVGFKMKPIEDVKERLCLEWAMRFALEAYFSSISSNYQDWLDTQKINDFFGYEVDFGAGYSFILFYNELIQNNSKPEEFKRFILEELKSICDSGISIDVLTQLKKRYYGQALSSLNSLEDTAIQFIRGFFNKLNYFDSLQIIHDITIEDVDKALGMIDLKNDCIVSIS